MKKKILKVYVLTQSWIGFDEYDMSVVGVVSDENVAKKWSKLKPVNGYSTDFYPMELDYVSGDGVLWAGKAIANFYKKYIDPKNKELRPRIEIDKIKVR